MNLLANGDFGGATYSFQEWGHDMTATQIPEQWTFWYRGRSPEDPTSSAWYRPEARVLRSQEAGKPPPPLWNTFTSYSTHCYALWQKVRVQPGKLAVFGVYAYPWSSNGDVWPQDDGSGSYWVRAGINPFGGNDPHSMDVIWSHGESGPDSCNNPQLGPQWAKGNHEHCIAVEAMPQGEWVTCFFMGYHEWPMKHGTCLWYDADCHQEEDEPTDLEARVAELERIVSQLGRLPLQVGDGQWTLATWEDTERTHIRERAVETTGVVDGVDVLAMIREYKRQHAGTIEEAEEQAAMPSEVAS